MQQEQSNYRLIALDLDGTLTNSRKEVTPRTIRAIQEAAARGVHIVLASGRPVMGIEPIARLLDLQRIGGYILAYNGSHVIDCRTGQDIIRRTVPREYYSDIIAACRLFGVNVLTYRGNDAITEGIDEYVEKELFINRIKAVVVPDLTKAIQGEVCKLLAVGEHRKLKPLQSYLRELYGDQLNIFFSETYFLEVVPPRIEKAASLEVLLQRLSLDRSQLIACGDGFNDITMISYAGLGVAMENAQPEVRERADYITDTNDRDGVAEVIEKFILHETEEPV